MGGTSDREGKKLLVFEAGGASYGILLEWVCAVREEAGEEVRGTTLVFDGREVPLLDLTTWFGRSKESRNPSTLLVVGEARAEAALRVDTPGRVLSCSGIGGWPELCRPMVEGVFNGVIEQEDGLVLVIDPQGICNAISGECAAESATAGAREARGDDQDSIGR